jgi:hypothetical protein
MLDYVCNCGQKDDHEHPHYPGTILQGTGPHAGFWYDPFNLGEHTNGAVPTHCRHYNAGIYHFAAFAGRCTYKKPPWPNMNTAGKVHIAGFNAGRRGTWKHVEREQAGYNAKHKPKENIVWS